MSGSEKNLSGGRAAQGSALIGEPLVLEFDNNRLLPELYGEHGKHLSRIEQTLDVSLANRGNQVFVSGAADNCARAEQVLSALYAHLERGAEVTGGDVDGALRLSLGSNPNADADDTPEGAPDGAGVTKPKSGKTTRGNSNGKGTGRGGEKGKKLYGGVALRTQRREVLPRSSTQADYIQALVKNELVVGLGPAGTG